MKKKLQITLGILITLFISACNNKDSNQNIHCKFIQNNGDDEIFKNSKYLNFYIANNDTTAEVGINGDNAPCILDKSCSIDEYELQITNGTYKYYRSEVSRDEGGFFNDRKETLFIINLSNMKFTWEVKNTSTGKIILPSSNYHLKKEGECEYISSLPNYFREKNNEKNYR